ncbi:MAG: hypothetical protein F4W92_09000 [Gammaproteobacteria bacterium]|nr:hypothetical protein [Gammaproteobacteria bacterium]
MKKIGLKDQPITDKCDEALGIVDYADVLTEFIEHCDTPLTIALQGGWGTGKTSLMNLIRQGLTDKSSKKQKNITVWFNTWQYSQFDSAGCLAISMMQNLTTKLRTEQTNATLRTRIDEFSNFLKKAGTALAVGGGSLVGQADAIREMLDIIKTQNGNELDSANILSKLKDEMENVINEVTVQKASSDKIVVFVDDLDRIPPMRAVELLEAMKVFLDIDKCVYVLACDYGVVETGLKEKFNWDLNDLKGKSFFDKIIQVPFKMPLKRYEPEKYLGQLLTGLDLQFIEEDITKCQELIEHSIEFNPRTIKRLLNTLQLLVLLNEKKFEFVDAEDTVRSVSIDRRHSNRVMMGILCMVEAYEPLYDYIVKDVSTTRLRALEHGLKDSEEFAEMREKLLADGDKLKVDNAAEFFGTFLESVQLDGDKDFSMEEISHLRELFSHSALVGHSPSLSNFDEDEFAFDMRAELNHRFSEFVNCQKPQYGQFRKTANTVYLKLKWHPHTFLFLRGDGLFFYFGLECPTGQNVAHDVGEAICKEFNWECGQLRTVENVKFGSKTYSTMDSYLFVVLPRSSEGAEDRFKEEIYSRLQQLTYKVSSLHSILMSVVNT